MHDKSDAIPDIIVFLMIDDSPFILSIKAILVTVTDILHKYEGAIATTESFNQKIKLVFR